MQLILKIIKYILLWGSLLVLLAFLLTGRISHVECQTNSGEMCPENIMQELDILINQSFFFTKIESQLEAMDIPHTSLKRKFPNTISITTTDLSFTKTTSSEAQSSLQGQLKPEHQVFSENLFDLPATIQQVDYPEPNTIQLTFENNVSALLPTDPEIITQKTTILKIILEQLDLRSIDTNIVEIDLRFKLPILKTKKSF